MSPVRTQNISLIHSEFSTFESANASSPTQTQERTVSHKMDSKCKMAKATETTPQKPTETGVKFRSLLSKAHPRYFAVNKKVLSFNLDAGSQTSCFEVLMQNANPGARDPTSGTRGFTLLFRWEPSEGYCWLTPIWGWSASGSSSSTSALYSSNASSSASGSPSNQRREKRTSHERQMARGQEDNQRRWIQIQQHLTGLSTAARACPLQSTIPTTIFMNVLDGKVNPSVDWCPKGQVLLGSLETLYF